MRPPIARGRIAAACEDGTLMMIKTSNHKYKAPVGTKLAAPRFRLHAAAAIIAMAPAAAQSQSLTELWRVEGFTFPEAAQVLPDGRVAISDRGAGGSASDGRVALIGTDGAPIDMGWVSGLVNPFGMAASDGLLYVVDGAVGLQVIDIASGTLLDQIPLPDTQLPNDMTAGPDGTLYVTDTAAGGVIRVRDGAADWLAPPGTTPAANGIIWSGQRVIVGTMGEGLDLSDFSVDAPGGLLSVDPATGEVSVIDATRRSASVDGVADLDGTIIYNDNPTGRVLALKDGELTEIGSTAPESGALSGAGELLVIPQIRSGYVAAYRVEGLPSE